MNILIYSQLSAYEETIVGGAEVSLKLLAEKLALNGHRVAYATQYRGGRPRKMKHWSVNEVDVYKFFVYWVPDFGGRFLPALKSSFIEWQIRRRLKKIIKDNEIDVVYVFGEPSFPWHVLRLKESEAMSFKVVVRMSGLTWIERAKSNGATLRTIQWVFDRANCLNFVNKEFEELYLQKAKQIGLNITNSKSWIGDIGYDNNIFKEKWVKNNTKVFKLVMVARFDLTQKRQDILCKAMTYLKDMPIELHFVGDGPLRINSEIILKQNENIGAVFHGYINRDAVRQILLDCDLFCLATEFEGLSKALLEAMSLGLPVLTSDVKPLNSFIEHGKNGFLAVNEPEAWANMIRAIHANKWDLETISSNQRQSVIEAYNPDVNVVKYIQLFKQLISTNNNVLK